MTRTNGARVYVLMNISQEPIQSFWIRTLKNPTSIYQEVVYETLPAFCSFCKVQGHNSSTCKASKKEVQDEKKKNVPNRVWVSKNTEISRNIEAGHVGHEECVSKEPVYVPVSFSEKKKRFDSTCC